MATDLERLVVQLSADITKYERSLARALSQTNSNAARVERRFKTMNSNVANTFTALAGRIAAPLAAAFTIKEFGQLQDSYIKIQNALKVTGLSGEALNETYQKLYATAQRNAAPIEALATVYSRVSINQKELGVNSERILGLSDNIGKALKAQGTSAAEAQGPLLQLSQAFGTGRVMAEEYNSLLEGLPVLLQAAAAGIQQAGGSVAKLTVLVKSGQISSKALFDGIEAGSHLLDERLSGSSETAAQSLTRLENSLTNAAGKFGEATGASDLFRSAVGKVVNYLDTVTFDNFVLGINNVIAALDQGISRFTTFFEQAGKAAGLTPELAASFTDTSRQNNAINDYFSGETGSRQAAAAAVKTAERQLDVQKQIAEIRQQQNSLAANDPLQIGLRDQLVTLTAIRDRAKEARQELAPDRKPVQGPLNFQGPIRPNVAANPINIEDEQYKPPAADKKSKKTAKERLDDYQKEVAQIKERTAATEAETAAQAKLNPLIDDYGFAVAKARAQIDLETAAKKAGKEITPELATEIEKLATAYASAEVAAAKLSESQEKVKQTQQEVLDLQKDVSRGIVDGFIQGKSAADIFSDALSKIANKILDLSFDSLFDGIGKSGSSGPLGGFFKLLGFATGGYTGAGGKYEPAGVVHKGEYVIPKNVVDSVGVENLESLFKRGYANGGLVGNGLATPSLISSVPQAQQGVSAVYSPTIDARGASVEAVDRLERIIENDRRNFAARVETTVRKARASNKKGF